MNHSLSQLKKSQSSGVRLALLAGLLLQCFSHTATAQDSNGASLDIGDTRLTPSVEIGFLTNDNIFLSSTDRQSTSGIRVSPLVQWEADKGTTSLGLSYSGDYGSFDENVLNFDDHRLQLTASQGINKRFGVSGDISISQTHEELGANLTAGIAETLGEQLIFNDTEANALLVFGARQAKGNIRLGLGYFQREADNFQDIANLSERVQVRPFAEIALRISQDTRFVFGASLADVDFEVDSRDREITSVYAGFNYSATGKLSGSLTAGVSSADFVNLATNDSEELVVNVGLRYEASSFSIFTLRAIRDFDLDNESTAGQQSVETLQNRFSLGWRYNWSSLLFHQFDAGLNSQDRVCPSISTDTVNASFFLNRFITRWLTVGAGVAFDRRDSDACDTQAGSVTDLDYDRQIIGINFKATL